MAVDDLFGKPLSDYSILIVDDEKIMCDFLKEALSDYHYRHINSCYSGRDALKLIEANSYDLVITDLKLGDLSGMDVLAFAKERDDHTEVIIVTGYASLDTATQAVNLGASSYLIKPLSLERFVAQVERAVANRAFHLKSVLLMRQSEAMEPGLKDHLLNVTSLFQVSRRLILSLEIPEILEIILDDTNRRMEASMCAVAVGLLDFTEVFAMPHTGSIQRDAAMRLIVENWSPALDMVDKQAFEAGSISLTIFEGLKGEANIAQPLTATGIPMTVKGKTLGALVIYRREPISTGSHEFQFLYVYTSLIASIIEHAVLDMQAQLQAKTDGLTGIANHRMFHEHLQREISRSDRRRSEFGFVLIDIDDFKKVNDTHGHLVGDQVLRDLTAKVSSVIRAGDMLARYGGEEFALVLPDTGGPGAQKLAERVREAIEKTPYQGGDTRIAYTISLGVSVYTGTEPRDKNALIADADRALYLSKSSGKNRVTVC